MIILGLTPAAEDTNDDQQPPPRRTAAQWQTLLADQRRSGLVTDHLRPSVDIGRNGAELGRRSALWHHEQQRLRISAKVTGRFGERDRSAHRFDAGGVVLLRPVTIRQ